MSGLDSSVEPMAPESPATTHFQELLFDSVGPLLKVGTESNEEGGGSGVAISELRDPVDIYHYLAETDPTGAQWFADAYERWEARQTRPLTSFEIEHSFANLPGTAMGPSSPIARAQRIDKPQMPQAIDSTPDKPRSPEHRTARADTDKLPATPALPANKAPKLDYNERRHLERQEALRQKLDQIDPTGSPSLDLETRIAHLPVGKRREVEDFLIREWVRSEDERKSTLVWGRNGRVWTRGEEEKDKVLEVLQQGLEEAEAASGSLGGALLMSAGAAAGVSDHQILMNLANIGSTFEEGMEARAARGGRAATPSASARRPSKTKSNSGSKAVKGKRATKPARTGTRTLRPVRILAEVAKSLELTKLEIKIAERVAEVFREEMKARLDMSNQTLASVHAHEATQARIAKEFGDVVIIEPGTGVSAPGHKRGDIQVFRISGDGLVLELKRTAFVREDGTLVTKGMEASDPGQTSQIDCFEVLHHHLGTPVIVINASGAMFGSAKPFDSTIGGGWMQVGGPK